MLPSIIAFLALILAAQALTYDFVLENLITNKVEHSEVIAGDVAFNIFESGIHKSDGKLVELLYERFTPLNFTSIDNGLMVADLCKMANAAYLDRNHGDVLYLYMLTQRNGVLDDMSLVNSSSFARAVTELDGIENGQIREMLSQTTTNERLADFYRTALFEDGLNTYHFQKNHTETYEKGYFSYNISGICRSKTEYGDGSPDSLKDFLKCLVDYFFR